ncbi:MAG: glycosyltransferase [Deltaproteobacteria bacterium]|nr:glycosyltransferase [Deltaproteobacteria bacterium]
MQPLVSVVIPTYNRWPMLCEAIESVLRQSFKDFELIVVDDGSEDGTVGNLMKCFSNLRVPSQPRRGVAAARNLGVRCSSGRYLAFLDSDDLWRPKKLEAQAGFMMASPQAEICQTEEIWIRHGRRVNPRRKHRKPSGDLFRASLDLCLISPSAVMMTRELFDRVGGFDETFAVCEDYDLWLRVTADTPVYLVPEPLVVKRGGHQDQLSRSTWGLDRFRVMAIRKLLASGLQGEKRMWAIEALAHKVAILSQGARKREKESEALNYERLLFEITGEIRYAKREDSRLWEREGVSPKEPGAMA